MTELDFKQSLIQVADVHASRLEHALNLAKPLYPFTEEIVSKLDYANLSNVEVLVNRFSKLQDLIGTKVFTLILNEKLEDTVGKTAIDIFNMAEKYYLIPSKNEWTNLREIRNHLAHEYPNEPDVTAKHLNEAVVASKWLLDVWKNLKKIMEENQ